MENIYQQAIADAKALRASAMANAKAALQEAFEPKIEEMVRMKLSEELEELEQVEETELEEADELENEGENVGDYKDYSGDGELGESELEEILAELEALSEESVDNLEEAYSEKVQEAEEDETEDEVEPEDEEGEAEGEEETQEITVSLGDLKEIIEKLKSLDPALSDEAEATDDEAMADDSEESEEETITLDEILAELEMEEGAEELGKPKAELVKEPETQGAAQGFGGKKIFEKKKEDGHKALEAELEEAKATIQSLQESFNEINLLNAKLLYMNKIFKAKSLTESQKINVVKAFDKATSVKEVKNTFEILKESATTQKKSQINESFGYASKPAGVSPKANVIDADPFVSRWQKLAGI